MQIFIPKHDKLGEGFTTEEMVKAAEHPGRQTNPRRGYQSAATWIDHLVQLRRPVILCGFCRHKFDPKKHRYRRFYCYTPGADGYKMNGRCDDCKEETIRTPGGGTMFISEESYPQLCLEPQVARRLERIKWKQLASTVARACGITS